VILAVPRQQDEGLLRVLTVSSADFDHPAAQAVRFEAVEGLAVALAAASCERSR
jgi:hypothetical protein